MIQLHRYTTTSEQHTEQEKEDQTYQSMLRLNSCNSLQVSCKKKEFKYKYKKESNSAVSCRKNKVIKFYRQNLFYQDSQIFSLKNNFPE